MGLDFRRPPLPAPTESMDESSDFNNTEVDLATNVTTRTDKTSYSIPEDGRPITISTQKITSGRDGSVAQHKRDQSQTSLLIEYFEASKTGDKSRSRPSVRVKVTPSSHKKGKGGNEAIQITGIGTDQKTSYTRRISLGNSSRSIETGLAPTEGTEVSHSSESNISARPPIEVEVLNNSELSHNNRSSRGLMYAPLESNVSSMPPDSMLEGEDSVDYEQGREADRDQETPTKDTAYLKAPARTGSRSRSASRERLTQKVMEKLGASSKPRKSNRSSQEHDFDYPSHSRERRRRSSKSQRGEEDTISGVESSLMSSKLAPSETSYRSSSSQASRLTNNPKLLEMVEDTIKRVIMPEINALKEDQKTDRKLRKYSESGSVDDSRLRESSSTPNISSKPKVVLNRQGDDPGTVLSRGDSASVKQRKSSRESPNERPSSRRSSGRHSRQDSYDDFDEKIRHKSSRGSNTLRGAAAAGLAAGVLTTAASKNHDPQHDMHRRRRKRSRSKDGRSSRSASIADAGDQFHRKEAIPPMPLASQINDSEVTRESILSQETDRPRSRASSDIRTPIREVSRGSIGDSSSQESSRTPTRTQHGHNLGMSMYNYGIETSHSPASNRERLAALTAAGLGGAAATKGVERKISSPVQSVSSLRKNFEDDEPLVPQALRPHSRASRSSAGRLHRSGHSQSSLRSTESPPTTKLAESRKQSQNVGEDELDGPREITQSLYAQNGPGTPAGETAEQWFERQHLVNDRYRSSLGEATNRESYQTNPYPEDEKRFTFKTTTTDDSFAQYYDDGADGPGERNVQSLGLNPNYVHTPVAVESAVASLMEPSTVSSHIVSSHGSPGRSNGTYSDRMAEHLRAMGKETPAMYEGSTLSQSMPSQDRWAAIKGKAQNMSESINSSPRQSPARSLREQQSLEQKPVMSASGLPLAHDPMPEIGHYDDTKSELDTNPSVIQGPLGGDDTGNDTWPYTPEPQHDFSNRSRQGGKEGTLSAAGHHRPAGEDAPDVKADDIDREMTPTGSPAFFRDEGYATDARTRSGGGITPKPEQQRYEQKDLDDYARAMSAHDLGADDPFALENKHARHFSGNSHGMDSPLYDSSTGKGMNNIESKDIVALMDHLTVRDAQRNARDTEILVTLVRSAAEMRQSFDEMKRFIAEQDKLIMQNTDRSAENTAQKVLGGPRPQPTGSPRTPRRTADSEEDVQTKRKGVLRRALKGLTGGKSAKDLAKIEDMLAQILDNVEDLKMQNGSSRPMDRSYTNDSLDSYERLRNAPDSGYEPEGQAGTSSTPSQSGNLNVAPREKQQFHSGYDGRRGSDNRVSTVMEDDEDDLEPHETHVLSHQFENNERMLTPTQENHRNHGVSPTHTPPKQAVNYTTPDKRQKHKSNNSSLFGVPKVSRWSRTTASSAAPDPATLDSPKEARQLRPSSESSRSKSTLDQYDDDSYDVRDIERGASQHSLAKSRAQDHTYADTKSARSRTSSRLTRTPSPLIPSEASANHRSVYGEEGAVSPVQQDDEVDLDDPKYHAHRNSILLQHPQPRPGATPRHQNNLESQAHTFDDTTGTNSDLSQRTVSDFDPSNWGSSATAGLARHRLTQIEPLSPVSLNSPGGYGSRRGDDGPLVPQPRQPAQPSIRYEEPESDPEQEADDWEEPQFSNSGFSRGGAGYYSSPYGSGHLLEPIEEVRYSLETDSRSMKSVSPEPQLASAKAVDMRSPQRKITGPRPMGGRSPNYSQQARLVENTDTVRRKPVPPRSEGTSNNNNKKKNNKSSDGCTLS